MNLSGTMRCMILEGNSSKCECARNWEFLRDDSLCSWIRDKCVLITGAGPQYLRATRIKGGTPFPQFCMLLFEMHNPPLFSDHPGTYRLPPTAFRPAGCEPRLVTTVADDAVAPAANWGFQVAQTELEMGILENWQQWCEVG